MANTYPANAHRPYVEKKTTLNGPDGKDIFIEYLYGDGIFAKDPMRIQLRHQNGGLIAATNVTDFGLYYCPQIENCYVATYGIIIPFPRVFRVDAAKISYPPPPFIPPNEESQADWQNYHTNEKAKRLASYSFGYPEMERDSQQGLETASALAYIAFIPLVFLANLYLVILGFLLGYAGRLMSWLASRGKKAPNKTEKSVLYLTCAIYSAMYILFMVVFLLMLGLYEPYLFTAIGLWLGLREKKKQLPTTTESPQAT